ncbi:MAG: PAS domain-containing protein, partial [Pyrinomonadaceae bacterium]
MTLKNSGSLSNEGKEQFHRRYLDAITNNASVALLIMDDRQHCVFINPAGEKLTGYK